MQKRNWYKTTFETYSGIHTETIRPINTYANTRKNAIKLNCQSKLQRLASLVIITRCDSYNIHYRNVDPSAPLSTAFIFVDGRLSAVEELREDL